VAGENKIIVDTYAIIADLVGDISSNARSMLDSVRYGEIKGLLHPLIVFELAYYWRKGRLPFKDINELMEFIDSYFTVLIFDKKDMIEASYIKVVGDSLLDKSTEPSLKGRRLSVSDATSIALALKHRVPIITGDADLAYVARYMGVKIIW